MRNLGVFSVAGVLGVAAIAAIAPHQAANAAADDGAMKVELGRRLFFEPGIGRRGRVGCAECHQPESGFSDPRQFSEDEDRRLPRHSQPVVDVAGGGFHWDGEFPTVRDLVDSRVLPARRAAEIAGTRFAARLAAAHASGRDTKELETRRSPDGYSDVGGITFGEIQTPATPVAVRLSEDGRYDEGFRLAFGDATITPERVSEAIDLYVRSLRSSENAYDRFAAGREDALTASAKHGLELFRGKANCASCHVLDAAHGRAAFTDGLYHDTGISSRPLVETSKRQAEFIEDHGRAAATLDPADKGSFKTPSLRDVAKRAPYMHSGAFVNLGQVVEYYDAGGTPHAGLDPKIKKLGLTAAEKTDLVAFLESLTGSERPGLGAAADFRAKELRVRIEGVDGEAAAFLKIRVVPCGDRLRGTTAMPAGFDVTTDGEGGAAFAWPLSTHVRLESNGAELGLSRPIPDWVATTTLVATPTSMVTVRVRSRAGASLPEALVAREIPEMRGGCGCVKITEWKLTRVRTLSPEEALYKADIAPEKRSILVSLAAANEANTELGRAQIQLDGGASETIDLGRAELLHEELTARQGGRAIFTK
jgi:cytochrome c peroxidase